MKNIYLIGYRCSGKTTIGKKLADLTGLAFVDADIEITLKEKNPISDIVKQKGWNYFRNLESKWIEEIALKSDLIVGTGGGVVLDEHNIIRMQKSGTVIWLNVSPHTVIERISKDCNTEENRPSLTGKKLEDEIEETLSARIPIYNQAADFSIITDTKSTTEICDQISDHLNSDAKE